MIVLVNPRATKPKNRRFPLSIMSLGAMLPEGQSWAIVDGNLPGVNVADEVADAPDYDHVVEFLEAHGFSLIATFPVTWDAEEPRVLEYHGFFLREDS